MGMKSEGFDAYLASDVVQLKVPRETNPEKIDFESKEFAVRNVTWTIYAVHHSESIQLYLICLLDEDEEENANFSINAEIQASILGTELKTAAIQKLTGSDWSWEVPKSELPADLDELTFELKLSADEPEGIEFEPPKKKLKLALQPEESVAQGKNLASLINSEKFSDVIFVVAEDGTRVKAHKNILSARSKVFDRMLSSDMKETRDGEIEVVDMGASALKILLRFIYSGQLDFPKEVKLDIELCKQLINAGNMYELPNFKEYAAMALSEFVSIDNALELLRFVKLHKATAATSALRSYFVRNVERIVDKL